jgi:hypothetical protein
MLNIPRTLVQQDCIKKVGDDRIEVMIVPLHRGHDVAQGWLIPLTL